MRASGMFFSPTGMIARGHHHQRIRRKGKGLDIGLTFGCLAHDVEVVLVGADALQDAIPVRDLESRANARKLLAELSQQLRGEILGRGDDAEAQTTALDPFQVVDLHLQVGQGLEDCAAGIVELGPGLGGPDLTTVLLEQRQAQDVGQLLGLHRHRGLGDEQLVRGAGEAAEPHDSFEDLQCRAPQ